MCRALIPATMAALLLGSLWAAEPPQDAEAAEKLYRAMESKLSKAKTVLTDVIGTVEETSPLGKSTDKIKGRLALDGTARSHIVKSRVQTPGPGRSLKSRTELIGDGGMIHAQDMMNVDLEKKKWFSVATPAGWAESLKKGFALRGLEGGHIVRHRLGVFDDNEGVQLEVYTKERPQTFVLGAKEMVGKHSTQVVEYSIVREVSGKQKVSATCKVWIDVKTSLPVKRELLYTVKKVRKYVRIEQYGNLTIDGKIDASEFSKPK